MTAFEPREVTAARAITLAKITRMDEESICGEVYGRSARLAQIRESVVWADTLGEIDTQRETLRRIDGFAV